MKPNTRGAAHRQSRDPYARLRPSLSVETTQSCTVSMVGGAFGLVCDLARNGVGSFCLCDFDTVDAGNVARTDFDHREANRLKVDTVAERILAINPDCYVHTYPVDVTKMAAADTDRFFGESDLVIIATDDFNANAYANAEAMRRGTPILNVSLYEGGGAGEIIYFVPKITPACCRCIAKNRYAYYAKGHATRTPSDGATIFDLRMVDAVAGQIALGILTRGKDNRYGTLIEQLGDRNLIQIRNDPAWLLGGKKDIFRAHLGDSPANFSFTSICLPMAPEPDCPDCRLLREHQA